MTELREIKIKRLKMRSMRRGIKEMDLILQSYATAHLDGLSDSDLDLYDKMLDENDHDLYQWVCRLGEMPAVYGPLMGAVRAQAEGVVRP